MVFILIVLVRGVAVVSFVVGVAAVVVVAVG